MVRLVSWNINGRDVLEELRAVRADVALLQEARQPVNDWGVEILPQGVERWATHGGPKRLYRTAIARVSDRVEVRPLTATTLIDGVVEDSFTISLDGSITAADVLVGGSVAFTAVSIYAAWEMGPSRRGFADASAHRILSDLSVLLDRARHRLVVAGDWNLLRGYGEEGSEYWKRRYATVFERAESLGLVFAGPQAPDGRQTEPWPDELPVDSTCVPTFHHSRQTPSEASRQLDFVFVSESLADRVHVRAMNAPEEWGPSDHCRIIIDVDEQT